MSEPDGVGVVLYNDRRVLLQKRDGRPKLFPNYWVVFGGEVRCDEEPKEAARRELKEELGVSIPPDLLRYLGVVRVIRKLHHPLMRYYSARLLRNLRELKLCEGDGFAYFYQEEIHLLRMRPEDRLALDRHFETLGFGWRSNGSASDCT